VAEQVNIGSGKPAKVRSVWVVAILSLVTLGIYVAFWWYFVNREMADFGRARGTNELGDSPGKSVLAITLGALVIVPAILSYINTFKRVQATQRLTGQTPISGWIGVLLLVVISPAFYAYVQSGLNSAWQTLGGQGQAVV
jgi:Domain of unknown function (DUF4234)